MDNSSVLADNYPGFSCLRSSFCVDAGTLEHSFWIRKSLMVGEHFVTNVQLTQWTLSPISIDLENESFFSPQIGQIGEKRCSIYEWWTAEN